MAFAKSSRIRLMFVPFVFIFTFGIGIWLGAHIFLKGFFWHIENVDNKPEGWGLSYSYSLSALILAFILGILCLLAVKIKKAERKLKKNEDEEKIRAVNVFGPLKIMDLQTIIFATFAVILLYSHFGTRDRGTQIIMNSMLYSFAFVLGIKLLLLIDKATKLLEKSDDGLIKEMGLDVEWDLEGKDEGITKPANKLKKVIRNPMFIGAAAGLSAAIILSVLRYFALHKVIHSKSDASLQFIVYILFEATAPVLPPVVVMDSVRPWFWDVCMYTWYILYGFFAGLFYKILRRKFKPETSLAMVIAVILVLTYMFLYYGMYIFYFIYIVLTWLQNVFKAGA